MWIIGGVIKGGDFNCVFGLVNVEDCVELLDSAVAILSDPGPTLGSSFTWGSGEILSRE